ncbi:tetratricopeptide repeat protein [Candidatus Gracilibacteria bacterium]|nr:tetratricopeptide repeat protein [Candidatus Gracilibacteria bacterium]NJM89078.1 tetratricopeptide repeat protein [Hydrococcus sp. RU_2_2]
MLERVARAIEHQDYQSADLLLKQLKEQDPDNPWISFYMARLEEASGHLQQAEKGYKNILRNTTHPKVIAQARQGIERLTQIEKEQRQLARERAAIEPGSQEIGILVIEPIASERREDLARKFAKIMNLDLYIARLQLPTRSWRLYRTGNMGDLRFYRNAFTEAEIPCFCVPLDLVNQIEVYRVQYFQAIEPQVTVICQYNESNSKTIRFDWSEVSQQVEGLLPIFEQCVDLDFKGRLIRKTQIQDYAKFCDFHLPARNMILRLCDRIYQFREGITFFEQQKSTDGKTTMRNNWEHLMQFVKQNLAGVTVISDFNAFAGTTMDFDEILKRIEPHINLMRREATLWDNAFQLFSGLHFIERTGNKATGN